MQVFMPFYAQRTFNMENCAFSLHHELCIFGDQQTQNPNKNNLFGRGKKTQIYYPTGSLIYSQCISETEFCHFIFFHFLQTKTTQETYHLILHLSLNLSIYMNILCILAHWHFVCQVANLGNAAKVSSQH